MVLGWNRFSQDFILGFYELSFQDRKACCLFSEKRAEGAEALKTRVITAQGQDR